MQQTACASNEYAAVYLLDSPYVIDTSYDYFVPMDMRHSVRRGSFVTVPFGRNNRKQLGIVEKLTASSSYPTPKSICEVCSDREPLSEEMMSLCEYMRSSILCTMGDAVRSVVPAAALGKLTEYYSLKGDTELSASAGFTASELFIYKYIASRTTVSMDTLKGKFSAGAAQEAVAKLMSRGLLERSFESAKISGGVYDTLYAAADSEVLAGIHLTSQKQKLVLELLSARGELGLEDIMSECGVTEAPVKSLVQKGAVIVRRERRYRDTPSDVPTEQKNYILNDEQARAAERIKEHLQSGQPHAVLLHGVTGSGKTSVIIASIDEALRLGRGVIALIPEIALTPQTLGIFQSRYGSRVALVHSGLSAGERYDAYTRILSGQADVVVGTRSAVFSPVKDLGLIIIDEEHETTYKSETSPKYHARDIARWRCAHSGAVMLLSSATPSVESYTKAMEGKYELLKLTKRYGEATLPSVSVYDMRQEPSKGNISPLGRELKERLAGILERGEQAVLFLNRRGYNTAVTCRDCGKAVLCPHCSVSMSYHADHGDHENGFLFCHWCGTRMRMPRACPSCSSEHLTRMGFGTQRIEKELSEMFPSARILRMDADSTSAKNSTREILEKFRNHDADILLGTQMVTKGHDFPDVTLVGVLLADMSLYLDDYHANERTFAMLTQVIGRAGRSEKGGVAVIQTANPDNNVIKQACAQDYEAFYSSEIKLRRLLTFPPYCDMVVLTVSSPDERRSLLASQRLATQMRMMVASRYRDVPVEVFGPFEAPVYKVEEKYRIRMIVKCRLNNRCREMLSEIMKDFGRDGKERAVLTVDFNPTGI